jgi:hypothetical protein
MKDCPASGCLVQKHTRAAVSAALGQKQTYALQQAMSALPPIATAKADMCHVRFAPESRHVQRSRLNAPGGIKTFLDHRDWRASGRFCTTKLRKTFMIKTIRERIF